MSPKSCHLSDNRGLYGGASSGNKRTINQNAPFQISTNQNEPQILPFFLSFKNSYILLSSYRQRSRGWRTFARFSPLSRERGHHATSQRVRRGRSSVSVHHRIRCQRPVLVVTHARHAYGMVHATTGKERLPTRIGAVVRTDGCGMVDLGIRTHGTRHTTPGQR